MKNSGQAKMILDRHLSVTHGQIAVFDPRLQDPLNEWTDRHFDQGFTWRPGSVSFRTLDEGGMHQVIIDEVAGGDDVVRDAVRVIDVPFDVPEVGTVEIASIGDSALVGCAPGLCELRFQALARTESRGPIIRLSFSPSSAPVFRVARADTDLKLDEGLLLTARPA